MKNKGTLNSVTSFYNKMSDFGKILVFLALFLILILFFKSIKIPNANGKEGFTQDENFSFKSGKDVYDDFYSEIYDYLVFSNAKDIYEVGAIMKQTTPTTESKILDIGCGTGHHIGKLTENGLDAIGLDISSSMINQAKSIYPNCNFKVGDGLNASLFNFDSFTHILCMYFTIYYFKDKDRFLNNCFNWLMPGGHLIVHVVDRDSFDPILPPGNPLLIISPQKYSQKRITSTKVKFNNFSYAADFDLKENEDIAIFREKFKFNDGKVRKQEHKLYMESESMIVNRAENVGFIVQAKVDLMKCAYAHQYLYIFTKPG
jgi:SAM-dependent methyltransferase